MKGDECQVSACTGSPYPCKHGGTCTMKENENDFICTCLEGYDGANCENTPCDTGEFCRMGKPSLQEGQQLEFSISPQSENLKMWDFTH